MLHLLPTFVPTFDLSIWRASAIKSEIAIVRYCSRTLVFVENRCANNSEQSGTSAVNSGTNKNGGQRFYSLRVHLPVDLNFEPILPAFSCSLNVKTPFPRNSGGNFAGAKLRQTRSYKFMIENNNEGGAPLQSSATNQQVNVQNEPNKAPPGTQAGAEPQITVTRVAKRGSKSKTIVLTKGLTCLKIEFEKARDGRKPWRVTWIEAGKECSEMHGSYDDAYTAAEVKLNQLAEGQRTLTRQELKHLWAFKLQVEQFNQRLAASERTLDQVVSDATAAAETLPGWTASQMAQFIAENHGVKNAMLVEEVKEKFLQYMEGGYKKKYSKHYIKCARRDLARFAAVFRKRFLYSISEEEVLDYITNYRVRPKTRELREQAGEDGLVPAGQKTKNMLHNLLNVVFDHAKKVLGALPRRMDTVIAMLAAPSYDVPTPEIYTYREIVTLYSLMPDLECVLFISLQLYAGLRPCECDRMRKKDIRRDVNGELSFIFVRQEVGKQSPKTGRRKIRTRKAPITPPLAALLNRIELPEGRVFHSGDIDARVRRVAHIRCFLWKHDSLRHSFISYRLADVEDRAKVAFEAGHDVDVQIEHYEGLIEDHLDVAKFWSFSIPTNLPATLNQYIVGVKFLRAYKKAKAQADNILPMPKVA
jgi:integrase